MIDMLRKLLQRNRTILFTNFDDYELIDIPGVWWVAARVDKAGCQNGSCFRYAKYVGAGTW